MKGFGALTKGQNADANLLVFGRNPEANVRQLEAAWGTCIRWADSRGMKFAPEKSELIHFNKGRRQWSNQLELTSPGRGTSPVRPKESTRFLGVWLDRKLNWKAHLAAVERKLRTQSYALSRLAASTWGLGLAKAREVYTKCIRSALAYGASSFHIPTDVGGEPVKKGITKALGKAQNKSLRMVAGAFKHTPIRNLETETWVPPLDLYLNKPLADFETRLQRTDLDDGQGGKKTAGSVILTTCQRIQQRLRSKSGNSGRPRTVGLWEPTAVEEAARTIARWTGGTVDTNNVVEEAWRARRVVFGPTIDSKMGENWNSDTTGLLLCSTRHQSHDCMAREESPRLADGLGEAADVQLSQEARAGSGGPKRPRSEAREASSLCIRRLTRTHRSLIVGMGFSPGPGGHGFPINRVAYDAVESAVESPIKQQSAQIYGDLTHSRPTTPLLFTADEDLNANYDIYAIRFPRPAVHTGSEDDEDDTVSICSDDIDREDRFGWYNNSRDFLAVETIPCPSWARWSNDGSRLPFQFVELPTTSGIRSPPPPPFSKWINIWDDVPSNLYRCFPDLVCLHVIDHELTLRPDITELPAQGRRWLTGSPDSLFVEVVDPTDGTWVSEPPGTPDWKAESGQMVGDWGESLPYGGYSSEQERDTVIAGGTRRKAKYQQPPSLTTVLEYVA
ncbi:hypothetical protein CHGG_08576 [Chaetomium globosum CBS 148.51]|uniref:Reverse transcriptase domain-containing protein n=1 Tax=Chaetomium globosum (strain ATCC 6205 / CBS 148.51 / DSM 1962 / NBRC 6347 / NRRL 1970) TaxID=306901 RepID=Q2GTX8_CHAGB|nr:uncharacterized protein CHGG_08576 [Chaetomium globosum CBS 148.51]EAQ84562.1 hypothetical protein CHGG_08576 [Chaetomium globosum CBS 148.51]